MKLKKYFAVLLMSICLFSASQSVSAIPGFDDPSNAINFIGGYQSSSLYLSTASDVDWFKYKNNTGNAQFTFADLTTSSYNYNYRFRLDAYIQYSNGLESNLFRAQDYGVVNLLNYIYLPPGATIFYRVSTENFNVDDIEFYSLTVDQTPA
ncbi:hypothetical protein PAT3040_00866 [Paenibacillus agaridevorans]|uniref:Secreted protein n=1 Tax=Paenibacillus agaridevorans TaxID=171404 RepID=A0A2R5ESH0_9BACL|nr:hypothetical protein [Paenibacillus agaridevorans]GBG06341.1 hypothetical protein PAT3040_00866 [Paenibacillus agaridevorans]